MLANNVRLFVMQEERLERLCVCTLHKGGRYQLDFAIQRSIDTVPVSLFILQVCSTVESRDSSVGIETR